MDPICYFGESAVLKRLVENVNNKYKYFTALTTFLEPGLVDKY